jgi:predicted MFS family arabinose efflux permease
VTHRRETHPPASASSPPAAGTGNPVAGTGIEWLLGAACGLIVANLYYGQPLNGIISQALGLARQNAGLVMTLPLAGYGLGLLFIVPLGDLLENRRLTLLLLGLEAGVLVLASLTSNAVVFLALAFLVGLTASVVQLLVPYVTYLVPAAERGQAVGRVVSGVMLGIMLARPVSSLVTDASSWHVIFRLSAVAMAATCVVLGFALPRRQPSHTQGYPALLASLVHLFADTEILRRRAFYHAAMFGAFSVFWTSVPLWLGGPAFNLSQRGIAWVALAGVAGAIAPPIAGRIADKGLARPATALAMLLAVAALCLTLAAPRGSAGVVAVAACAIALDFAVSANLVFGQRAIYALSEQYRSRMNGLFMATFFAGGAIGSALGAWCYNRFGWPGVVAVGAALPLLALIYWSTERPATAP